MEDLATRLAAYIDRLTRIAQRLGRDPASVRLLAVSKTHPAATIAALADLGVLEFGENYVQELAEKSLALSHLPLRFVYIGRIQSNKIPRLVQHAAEIQSVESLRHATLIAREAVRLHKTPYPIYLLVNAGDEATKGGVLRDEVLNLAATIAATLPELDVQGIMAIPPPLPEGRREGHGQSIDIPPLYRELRTLANQVGRGLLSLGMSDDLEEALAAGTNCVRIGTALFGPRHSA